MKSTTIIDKLTYFCDYYRIIKTFRIFRRKAHMSVKYNTARDPTVTVIKAKQYQKMKSRTRPI